MSVEDRRALALYVRSRRDAAVFYGLTHGLTEEAVQELLEELDEKGWNEGDISIPVHPATGGRHPAGAGGERI